MLCETPFSISYLAVPINKLSIRSNPFFCGFVVQLSKIMKNTISCCIIIIALIIIYPHADANTIHLSLIRLQMAKRGPDDIVFNHRMSRLTAAFLDSNNRIFFRLHIGCISQTIVGISRFRNEQNHSLICIYTYVNI